MTVPTVSRSLITVVGRAVVVLLVVALLAAAAVIAWLVLTGHRPVVITTGSMRPTAPPGTLIIAGSVPGDEIEVGDVVVMRRAGSTPVTHRVVDIVVEEGVRAAVTQGDANDFLDPAVYVLTGDDELVARWYLPGQGRVVEWLQGRTGRTAVIGLALLVICSVALRRIWAPDDGADGDDADDVPGGDEGSAGAGSPAPSRVAVRAGGVL